MQCDIIGSKKCNLQINFKINQFIHYLSTQFVVLLLHNLNVTLMKTKIFSYDPSIKPMYFNKPAKKPDSTHGRDKDRLYQTSRSKSGYLSKKRRKKNDHNKHWRKYVSVLGFLNLVAVTWDKRNNHPHATEREHLGIKKVVGENLPLTKWTWLAEIVLA